MHPKHLKQVPREPEDRRALAPYNFVELPEQVVEAELECNGKLRDNDRYYPDRHTGKIICTLKTESPLYIRCGLTPADFAAFGNTPNDKLTDEQRKKKAEFFQHPSKLLPILPGSSLRGMLRTLVEIVSFGKIERVSDQQKFFFRAVAAESDDPLRERYKDYIGNMAKNVRAGYLELDKRQNKWFIRQAQEVDEQFFIKVKEEDIKDDLPSLIMMNKSNYIPQYIQISFEGRPPSVNVSENLTEYSCQGWLVTSGNMLENLIQKTTEKEREQLLRRKEGRKYHYIVPEVEQSTKRYEISSDTIKAYRNALTNFQKGDEKSFENNSKNRFNKNLGVLQEGLPIFYCEPKGSNLVTLFGQSPNFRIPYSPNNDGKAASAVDFIPEEVGASEKIDLADAIFGFVRREKDRQEQDSAENTKEKREQSRAGRIFISDAQYKPDEDINYKTDEDDIWLTKEPITPPILANPKPTTFQHYLVQPEDTKAIKAELKHYGNPIRETVIRGHKLYWHKGNISKTRIKTDATEAEIKDKQSQYTQIKPIKAGVSFEFTIHFENLSNVELGALLWVLTISTDETDKLQMLNLSGSERYRLSLGMGKPVGMGAVMLDKCELLLNERYLNEPQQRYTQLFHDDNWVTGDRLATSDEYAHCIRKFEEYVIANIAEADLPADCSNKENLESLADVPRIQMLLAMLSWNFPPPADTRYMEIERDISKGYRGKPVKSGEDSKNEYTDRLVLPTPLQVKGWEDTDKRRFPDPTPPSQNVGRRKSNSDPARKVKGKREDKGGDNPVFVRPSKTPRR
jgi:CRISPR-associated protein (TIGR03986 family)